MSILEKIKKWYSGTTEIDEPIITPDITYISAPYTTYHWSAVIVRAVVNFYLKHWQWVWVIVVAILTLLYTGPWLKS